MTKNFPVIGVILDQTTEIAMKRLSEDDKISGKPHHSAYPPPKKVWKVGAIREAHLFSGHAYANHNRCFKVKFLLLSSSNSTSHSRALHSEEGIRVTVMIN